MHASAAHVLSLLSCLCPSELPFIDKDEFKAEFLSILSSALPVAKHPIVFVLTTENEATDAQHVVERIFGAPLLANPRVHSIQCRPISTTELVKAINRVAQCVLPHRPCACGPCWTGCCMFAHSLILSCFYALPVARVWTCRTSA